MLGWGHTARWRRPWRAALRLGAQPLLRLPCGVALGLPHAGAGTLERGAPPALAGEVPPNQPLVPGPVQAPPQQTFSTWSDAGTAGPHGAAVAADGHARAGPGGREQRTSGPRSGGGRSPRVGGQGCGGKDGGGAASPRTGGNSRAGTSGSHRRGGQEAGARAVEESGSCRDGDALHDRPDAYPLHERNIPAGSCCRKRKHGGGGPGGTGTRGAGRRQDAFYKSAGADSELEAVAPEQPHRVAGGPCGSRERHPGYD